MVEKILIKRYLLNDHAHPDTRYNMIYNIKDPHQSAFMFDMDSFYYKNIYEPLEIGYPGFYISMVLLLAYFVFRNKIKNQNPDEKNRFGFQYLF